MKQFFKCLEITLWNLSRRNNKVNIIEKYHQFLSKIQAIAGKHRVSHDIFIQNAKTSQYACNSSPIDDTKLMSSIVDIGRELIFNLYTELLPTTTLNPDNNQALFKYLHEVSMNSQLSISVLQILIE